MQTKLGAQLNNIWSGTASSASVERLLGHVFLSIPMKCISQSYWYGHTIYKMKEYWFLYANLNEDLCVPFIPHILWSCNDILISEANSMLSFGMNILTDDYHIIMGKITLTRKPQLFSCTKSRKLCQKFQHLKKQPSPHQCLCFYRTVCITKVASIPEKKKKLFTLLKKEIETKMMLWITTGITDEAWHT